MDVVLELFDYLLIDRVFATFAPASGLSRFNNATLAGIQTLNYKSYEPTSQYLYLGPSHYTYASSVPRENFFRQGFSLFAITWYALRTQTVLGRGTGLTLSRVFGLVTYFLFSGLSYLFVFDHATLTHPKYLKNQISLEIKQTMDSMPLLALCTTLCFLAEVRGLSKMYDTNADAPFSLYNLIQFPLFVCFTDFFIYWIHRGLHHPRVYKTLHKPHHKWIMPTPFASHAFHPLDGFAQSIPYHVFPFLFPLQKWAYIALFIFINIWTVMIRKSYSCTALIRTWNFSCD